MFTSTCSLMLNNGMPPRVACNRLSSCLQGPGDSCSSPLIMLISGQFFIPVVVPYSYLGTLYMCMFV